MSVTFDQVCALYPRGSTGIRLRNARSLATNANRSVRRVGDYVVKTYYHEPKSLESPEDMSIRATMDILCLHNLQDTGFVPKLFEVYKLHNTIYIVMEYLESCNFIPDNYHEQILHILTVFHARKIVHGDFYTRNRVITPSGKICVFDFEHAQVDGNDLFYDCRPRVTSEQYFDAICYVAERMDFSPDLEAFKSEFEHLRPDLPGSDMTLVDYLCNGYTEENYHFPI